MSLLTETLPIDRYANCFFGENFESALSVTQNGGVINGTPEISFGANFNGTTDYIVYNSSGWFLEKDPWSCNIEFWPDFAAGDDVQKRLLTVDAAVYVINKRAAANSHVLRISLGGSIIADVALATYEDAWRVGERNVLTIGSTSGDTNAWLNGVQIVTSNVTAWSPVDGVELSIGATTLGGDPFDGRITMFKLYNSLLVESDHRYYYGQG